MAEIQLNYTSTEINDSISKRHKHDNKAILDTINQEKINQINVTPNVEITDCYFEKEQVSFDGSENLKDTYSFLHIRSSIIRKDIIDYISKGLFSLCFYFKPSVHRQKKNSVYTFPVNFKSHNHFFPPMVNENKDKILQLLVIINEEDIKQDNQNNYYIHKKIDFNKLFIDHSFENSETVGFENLVRDTNARFNLKPYSFTTNKTFTQNNNEYYNGVVTSPIGSNRKERYNMQAHFGNVVRYDGEDFISLFLNNAKKSQVIDFPKVGSNALMIDRSSMGQTKRRIRCATRLGFVVLHEKYNYTPNYDSLIGNIFIKRFSKYKSVLNIKPRFFLMNITEEDRINRNRIFMVTSYRLLNK